MRRQLHRDLLGVVLTVIAAVAHAQSLSSGAALTFPTKPLRINSAPPGAGGDFTARVIAQALTANLGQPVIVDNRGGYASIEATIKAPPDGYHLLVYGSTL